MKLRKKIIIILFIVFFIVLSALAVYFFLLKYPVYQITQKNENSGQTDMIEGDGENDIGQEKGQENRRGEEQNYSKGVEEISQSAWIPYWDFDRGYESLVKNKEKFDSVSPVWYSLKADGSLISHKRASHAKLGQFVKENNINLIPTIGMFDFNIIKSVLNSEENYQRHITGILKVVDENDYDGIDIDYESIELVDKELFLKFIEELSGELKKRNKILTIDVLSKWGNGIEYPSLKQTREAQNWRELSKYVDEIRIMAYDYTSTNSRYPGPIGPISWMYEILQYAVDEIPRGKIVLGVHLYGYEWVNEKYNRNLDIFGNPLEEKIQVNAHEYSDIIQIKKNYSYNEYKDDGLGEVILEYDKNGSQGIIFYMSGSGVKARREMAAEFGIGGVAYWRLGGEDDSGF
ncbi:hypothetical protein JW796_00590 [Candidatus Dojkabacteria bacterium]|nr:hypothetical protein [Candidatus Dojkabacteria bacterium]